MELTDITIEILKDLRTELGGLREEARQTNAWIDETNKRVVSSEIRLATEIVSVAGAVREVRDLLRDDLHLRAKVDDYERRTRWNYSATSLLAPQSSGCQG
jgi:hypothetical protein